MIKTVLVLLMFTLLTNCTKDKALPPNNNNDTISKAERLYNEYSDSLTALNIFKGCTKLIYKKEHAILDFTNALKDYITSRIEKKKQKKQIRYNIMLSNRRRELFNYQCSLNMYQLWKFQNQPPVLLPFECDEKCIFDFKKMQTLKSENLKKFWNKFIPFAQQQLGNTYEVIHDEPELLI